MSDKIITVFGGSGFLGRYVVRALCKAGWRVRVAVRNPMNAGDMRVGGEVGQVQIIQANIRHRPSVERALHGSDAVINLVGILFERGRQTFSAAQAEGAENVAEIASSLGISQMVQMSAIGADADARAKYARTKALGEAAVLEHMPNAVILRPSIVFGPEDGFFNLFGQQAKSMPILPLVGGGHTKFQPIYVGDVAEAVLAALNNPQAAGRTFELGGPRSYTFRELLEYIRKQTNRKPLFMPLPFGLARMMGQTFSLFSKFVPFIDPPLTGDQVLMLKDDNIVGISGDAEVGTISDLGDIALETVEAITPSYLWRYRPYGQFQIQDEGEEVSRVDL